MIGSDAEYIVACTSGLGVLGGEWITLQGAEDLARDLSAQEGHERCLHQVHRGLEPVSAISVYFGGYAVTGAERPRYDVRNGGETTASFPGGPRGMDAAWVGVGEWLAACGVNGAHVVSVAEDGTETMELGTSQAAQATRDGRSASALSRAT